MIQRGRQKRRSIEKRRTKLAPALIIRSPVKKSKRKQWTNEQRIAAMEAVKTSESGINRAAVDHGVQKTTLKNRLSGHVKHGKKPGPECYLNEEEEKELASFNSVPLLAMAKHAGRCWVLLSELPRKRDFFKERKSVKDGGVVF